MPGNGRDKPIGEIASVHLAFEPFINFADLKKPFKLIPQGVFYRGKRKLEITAQRLMDIANNFTKGLPNFRVGINLDHEQNGGKVGDIKSVEYMPEGPEGPGLYVTDFELTDKGQAAIEKDGYDGVSAEIVWSLAGAKYQNPETGVEHDNVLVGMALTPKPFFGHGHVALYSASAPDGYMDDEPMEYKIAGGAKTFSEYEEWRKAQEAAQGLLHLDMVFRDLYDNIWYDNQMSVEDKAEAMIALIEEYKQKVMRERIPGALDGMANRIKRLFSREVTAMTDVLEAVVDEAEEIAAEEVEVAAEEAAEEAAVEESEEAAEEVEEAAQDDATTEELAAKQAEVDKLRAEIAERDNAAQAARLTAIAESFEALPVVVDEFAENFATLELLDGEGELVSWFVDQFKAFDQALTEAKVMAELGSELPGEAGAAEKFEALVEQTLTEKFEGKREHFASALQLTAAAHPDLAAAYIG